LAQFDQWTNVVGALPRGLILTTNGGISGTPATNGTFNFTVQVTDALSETATQALSLTIVLVDTNPPGLTITSPTPGQRWSNAVFTVTGMATDSVAVVSVLYSLNAGGWTPAMSTNSWRTWTASVALVPGTNTISAYAIDTSGNVSKTNTIKLDCILSATLTVRTNGGGGITPAYNGKLLQIGATYSMTAKTNIGFGFVNWTDGLGDVLTNKATMVFTMASNLIFIANFVDTAKPTLSITSPKPGEKWSNAVFTVTGTAKDNVAVSNVVYSVNNAGWSNAVTGNSWSNWRASITLSPGTNIIAAGAVDTSGNVSATAAAHLVYVVDSVLTVAIVGEGTLTPNDSGKRLQIGNNYAMKAAGTNGFAFYFWGGGVPMTANSTLNFTMASNLSITANFKDVTRPVATITFPAADQKWSNYVLTVSGKASDNVGVAGVWYQINQGGWTEAGTDNGFTNWSAAELAVVAGTNLVQAFAQDVAGNLSLTNEVRFVGDLPPAGMVLIPAGSFTMGDTLDGETDARPTNVSVSAFYMDTNLVSYSQWQAVYDWATNAGYGFANAGAGNATDNPVQTVDWYDCMKWCNARSHEAGLTPVYYTDTGMTEVYTNGENANVFAHWTANGYRLPTEAEWEKAARGGLSGQRFPWGDTISESQANYFSTNSFAYDLGPEGYNTNFDTGSFPYTSPVAYFAPNDYGLHDMAGNVFEWCWDWYGTPYGQPAKTNPTGTGSGIYRVFRGGAWNFLPVSLRTAYRGWNVPQFAYYVVGFRCVRGH
jgi:formylglycine-generating enzyme required for sulfatase activity